MNLIWLMAVSLLSLSFVRVFVGYDRAGNFLLRLQEFWVEFKWIYMNFGSFFGPAVPLFHFFFLPTALVQNHAQIWVLFGLVEDYMPLNELGSRLVYFYELCMI